MVSDKELLALKAVAHGCNINRKLVGATCLLDIKNPKSESILYFDAIVIVYELIDRLEKSKRKDGHSD